MKTVIAIDIDGTALEHPDKVRDLFYRKDTVIILHTSRPWTMAYETIQQLRALNIPFDGLQMEKTKADHYIDDKNSSFHLVYQDLHKETK
jgi:hypothetical protein